MPARNNAAAKVERLEARVPADVKAVLVRAAALQGQSLTDFVLSSATESARRVIREAEVLEFSERDQVAFAEALLNPPPASSRLREAADRYHDEAR